MKRFLSRRTRPDRVDAVVVSTLLAICFSYYLGFGLDWDQADGEPPTAQESAPPARTSAAEPVPAGPPGEGPRGSNEAAVEAAASPAMARAVAPRPGPADPDQVAWSEMVRRLAAESLTYRGRVAIYLKDLKRGRVWVYHADDLFPSASLVKVPIMACVFEKISGGELSLQTRVKLQRRHRVGGSGSLKWYRDGTQFTVRQLLEHSIDESDNTATRMLIETVGFGYLQQQFPKMGLLYTEIYPEGLSLNGDRVAYENYTTAREMSMLLEKIYRGELVDRHASQCMLDLLKHQYSRARLAKALPVGWEIAHKTGLLRRACHDSAVVFTPRGDYVLTVLTGQNRDYHAAKAFITRLGGITTRYYRGDPGLHARAAEYRLARRTTKPAVN